MSSGIRFTHVAGVIALVAGCFLAQMILAGSAQGTDEEGAVRVAIAQAQAETAQAAQATTGENGDTTMTSDQQAPEYRTLTPEEERVIVHKGTERPFSGEYYKNFAEGIYTCRRCGAMLYRSDDKFRSDCGWPSFDDEILGAVTRVPDADGRRTEIVCSNCKGHLGHVFTGEKFTDKNVRHCVNSVSMAFIPAGKVKFGRAIFAGGCFWGVESEFQRQPGVLETTAGYIGGKTETPTYEEVCSHTTGHAEAVEVVYDPVRISFETLAKVFFEMHDPTQVDRQGPDVGDQYRSEVFYTDKEQAATTKRLIADLESRGMKIATKVTPAGKFWPAEEYHQNWFMKKGTPAVCHTKRKLW